MEAHRPFPNAAIGQRTSVLTLGPFIVILKHVQVVRAKDFYQG